MKYYIWIVRMILQGNSPKVAYRFVIANTGFGFIDRRHPTIKMCKKAWMYAKFILHGMNPVLAIRLTHACMEPKLLFCDRRS